MSKDKKVAVTFKKPWRGYNKGEVAGFDEETAASLVDAGLADSQTQAKPVRGKQNVAEGGGEKTPANKPADGKGTGDGGDKSPDGNGAGTGGADDDRP